MKSGNFSIKNKDLAFTQTRGKVKKKGKVVETFGFRCDMTGLSLYDVLDTVPFYDDLPYVAFPDPHVFQGRLHTLVIANNRPYRVDGTSLVALSLGGEQAEPGNGELTSNGFYSWSDLGDYFVAVNGTTTLYGSFLTDTYYIGRPSIVCCGTFNGRTVYAGFDSGNTYNQEWEDFFNQYAETIPVTGLRRNYVMLCPVDTDPFWLFNPPDDRAYSLLKNNEIIFAPIPQDEQILAVGEHQGSLMVYTGLSVYTGKLITEPTIAFSRVQSLDFGIRNQGSVYMSRDRHLIVTSSNEMVSLGDSMEFHEYYQEISSLSNECRVLFDNKSNEHYITDGAITYLLTRFGMTEINDVIASLYITDKTYKV